MHEKTNLDRVQEVFRDILQDETLVLSEKSSPANIIKWDSIANMNILIALESEFGTEFTVGELQSIRSVRDILELVSQTS